ncbi:MAG: hypothetical protein K6G80_07900 [Treponema sp.]|nr:hypothetical protein [Treponema sp.]
MFQFFFKKNFCDGWDNLFMLIVTNLFSIALGLGGAFLFAISLATHQIVSVLVLMACTGVLMIPIFAWGANARKIADFNTPTYATFFRTITVVWKAAFLFGALFSLLLVVVSIGIRYYLQLFASGRLFGLLFAALLFWFLFICLLALQWFIPFYFLQEENTFIKCLKKSFIIFFDNPGFTFVLFLHNVLLLAVSVMLFFFVPGTSGIVLAQTNALRLRLYKYDWLEEMEAKEPGFSASRDKRAEVPWNELLAEDKEMLGPRGLKSFIFPWK